MPAGLPAANQPVLVPLDSSTWLVTASVPLDRYGPEILDAALHDLTWVGEIAMAHEAVVECVAAAAGAAVIPMQLFTMFRTVERAVAEMQGRAAELDLLFRRIAGCEEWGVRVVHGDRRPTAGRGNPPASPRSGAAFLAARKQVRDAARETTQLAAETADAAFSALAAIARDGLRRGEEPASAARPLLDAAFLVPSRRRVRFHAEVDRLAQSVARRGARITLTGPWPPYHFVKLEASR